MNRRLIRASAMVLILAATLSGFIYYFVKHPSVRHQLSRLSPVTLLGLLLLYFGTVVALALINASTVRLCRIKLNLHEGLLLTAYSSVINFFGPLQSGPAFRAVYLKKKYELNLKDYATATIVYYLFYGAFSGLFLLSSWLGWWLIVLAAAGLLTIGLASRKPQLKARLQKLDLRAWYLLGFASLLQVSLVAAIYYVELHSLAPSISLSQAIVYTGAANLALFVSITPGAIGFRESFLVFSQHLHHINNATIVAANIIDRALYITLMLILGVLILASHTRQNLLKQTS